MPEAQGEHPTGTPAAPKRRPTRRRRRPRQRGGAGKTRTVALHQRSASHFRPEDRELGKAVFSAGNVKLEVDGTSARAIVEPLTPGDGTTPTDPSAGGVARVEIDWSRVPDERILHAVCDCEQYAGGTACGHIWASLLELAANEPGSQPAGSGRVSLRKTRPPQVSIPGSALDVMDPADATAKEAPRPSRRTRRSRSRRRRRTPATTSWRSVVDAVREDIDRQGLPEKSSSARHGEPEIRFLINAATSRNAGGLMIDIFGRKRNPQGELGKLKRLNIDHAKVEELLGMNSLDADASSTNGASPEPAMVTALPPEAPQRQGRKRKAGRGRPPGRPQIQRVFVPLNWVHHLLPRLSEDGHLFWWDGRSLANLHPVSFDDGEPWRLTLQLELAAASRIRLRGLLKRGDETTPLSRAALVLPFPNGNGVIAGADPEEAGNTLLLLGNSIGHLHLEPQRDQPWYSLLGASGDLVIPDEDLEAAVTSLLELPTLPPLELPEEVYLSEESPVPQPRLALEPEDAPEWMNPQLEARLSFGYGSLTVDAGDPRSAVVDWEEHRFVRRDPKVEQDALVRLLELGLKPVASKTGHSLELEPRDLPAIAEPLLTEGWEVEAHGASIRPPSPPALRIESGVDWFELSGQIDFGGDQIEFSEILSAISEGRRSVELDAGSKGLLPAAWVENYGSLSQLAQASSEEGLRFLPSQALLVDALLAVTPPVNVSKTFAELREKLSTFSSIKPKKEPRSFVGALRNYQRLGLGWLCFLREFGLGGVLADDMGLGKTIQALALLRMYRTASRTTKLPYLVVAPRSLVYNWIDEAARFTPDLKVLEYAGRDREDLRDEVNSADLVVTTYGTVRRDIGYLATVDFDTVILDEAQAIKNATSQTAKACRLLNGQHRLALTGTPIENHLGELGSIFEFLNPGLLGRLPALDVLAGGRAPSERELALVAKGLRPFILRRSKREVLPDLPEKTEQILQCTLNPRQQEIYDQLRAGYRDSLLKQVEDKGVGGSAMQVLEALLRLRQVACHPGLIDESWNDAGSAKLESLFEQVSAVLDEGHKCLVFSQFTSLLAYVRSHFEEQGVPYAYLDGQTRNRGEVVDHFQNDPDTNIFLISLKAGGVGLNLTAAGYVFLLDPWWNPAVEAQAIDRTHRIGQTQPVFAYRLIARDTVEEKMLELQRSKRQIADAILEGGGSSLRDLTADDLRLLLS
ncbi:MAG: DEAD/DEAH box helicase [Holophagales bacterium]|nr:DEAD/DEAH box helicase [Holophagales bacterium]